MFNTISGEIAGEKVAIAAVLQEALAAAEKAGAAIFGDVGKALGREAGEKAAREIAAKLGRELGAEAGDSAGKTAGGIGAVKVLVLFKSKSCLLWHGKADVLPYWFSSFF